MIVYRLTAVLGAQVATNLRRPSISTEIEHTFELVTTPMRRDRSHRGRASDGDRTRGYATA
ncbi:hypothetical protein ABH37_07690 [Mycobacterium haemophilum]|uniref:Uncharacterized protein n=1 Tax=Mycobacterium haemophilum TaxID=29311 RepID=A0A0I9VGF7_9MYCO|nr:hypothetical protein ABH39_10185 [Mycobacterium haemophilum]KLO37769.1 hypothetical protein ABH38_07395 [Mycobacterium haemophilum]KLO43150.1 hypothetical protein ABH37_07690 [Mycobacterium haemophilum]KLO55591.1 hypothetical protein ABH36_06350 [Mycobacterium haemophilum]